MLARRPPFALLAWGALGFGGLAALACGPSFQVVYEGDARFEHCYALDDTPTVPMQEKTDCWTQWTKNYTYGQTRNRVDYAVMRARALRDVAIPTDEALMGAAPGGGTGRAVGHDEPVPTNAFAPPPKTMHEGDGGTDSGDAMPEPAPAAAASSALPPAPLPRAACTDRCRTQWQSCESTCKLRCASCDVSYNGCMKGCF